MDSLQIVCIICLFPEHLCDLTSQENEEIAKKLTDVTTIQIHANDSLPRCICYACIGTLNVAYDFLQQCREAKQRLQKQVRWEPVKNYEGLQIRISSIKEEPLDMIEDAQLLYGTAPDNNATEEDLSEGEVDLGDDRKDLVLEEAKLAELMTAESGCRKGSEPQQHLKTHATKDRLQLRDRSFSCQTCQKSYTTRKSMKRHMKRTHMGKKVLICYLCGKAFPQKAALEADVYCCGEPLTESKKKPLGGVKLKCTFCEKSNFRDRWKLKRHLRMHTKEQPYECNECHRKFSYNESLKRHQLIHSDEKPHGCEVCKMAFRQRDHLKTHKLSHTAGRSYKCAVCRKAFRNRTNFNIHMRLHEDSTAQQQRSVPKLVGTGGLTIKEEARPRNRFLPKAK